MNLRKAENDDLKGTVNKKFKIIARVPTITALVGAFDAKAFNDTEFLKSYLAGRKRIINFCEQTKPKTSR